MILINLHKSRSMVMINSEIVWKDDDGLNYGIRGVRKVY